MRPAKWSPPIRKKKIESDLNALNTLNVHLHPVFFVFISTSVANLHQTLSPLEAEIRQKARDAKLMPTSFEKD